MTKKGYEELAKGLAYTIWELQDIVEDRIVKTVSHYLHLDNPAFNLEKFAAAIQQEKRKFKRC